MMGIFLKFAKVSLILFLVYLIFLLLPKESTFVKEHVLLVPVISCFIGNFIFTMASKSSTTTTVHGSTKPVLQRCGMQIERLQNV